MFQSCKMIFGSSINRWWYKLVEVLKSDVTFDARKGRDDTWLLVCLLRPVACKPGGVERLGYRLTMKIKFVKTNRLLAGVILISCFVTFAEAREIAVTKWGLVKMVALGAGILAIEGKMEDIYVGLGDGDGARLGAVEMLVEVMDETRMRNIMEKKAVIKNIKRKMTMMMKDRVMLMLSDSGELNAAFMMARYKRTLKAIVRNNREFDTAKEKGCAREAFLNKCIEEFKEYYDYPPEHRDDIIKVLEGDVVVKKHLKTNMNGWKSVADKRVAKARAKGNMSADRREFSKMSEIGKENITASEIKHYSGEKPFDQRYEASSFYSYDGVNLLFFLVKYFSSVRVHIFVILFSKEMEEKLQKRLTVLEKSAYSIIGKVMTEVTNMVETLEEIEVTRARLDEEVQNLATRAYPNRDDPASKILWEEYIPVAAQMTFPLFECYKKVILEVII
ncbi:hypothetical protein POM88_039688 [Heracleum sosnowskyi]|uniref:Uncharacterized protein n=1 Tax=Heracleum sosnowskyi TaxID=360622 RepID=A0AAD8M926_9APIA|nr:hypothetical protein POM88_039688 [Heracleum sosnowskyi]